MSDKFKVIDHATFERMQQNSSNAPAATTALPKIRNSKYKRMTATNNFNLLQFVKVKQRGKSKGLAKNVRVRKCIVDTHRVLLKKRGKQRENGKVKKPSRLKKSILQYRQMKREQAARLEKEIDESADKLMKLVVNDGRVENEKKSYRLHSNRFREYCNCCTTPELKEHCEQLIRELNHFQRRAYAQNQIKARAHKRFVIGFHQVQNYLRINKIKLVIIATDCEHTEGDVTLDATIENIKTICHDQQIPVVFAFQRRQMAYFLYKKASVSCMGILDYDGARETYAKVIEALKQAREMYESLVLKEL
ncbi:selenocysteine insertion sequence-binding protein 2 [Lucilia cuprina]|uniref:selenocysteine insertion sequence-binding protein 2 n=1 Tax=Lucilia cuprina TaxID=7375 RepID=UPI001F0609A0|nr:selenocysteine insertion sequence-binding protein 2 [Lucilia cuprina]